MHDNKKLLLIMRIGP